MKHSSRILKWLFVGLLLISAQSAFAERTIPQERGTKQPRVTIQTDKQQRSHLSDWVPVLNLIFSTGIALLMFFENRKLRKNSQEGNHVNANNSAVLITKEMVDSFRNENSVQHKDIIRETQSVKSTLCENDKDIIDLLKRVCLKFEVRYDGYDDDVKNDVENTSGRVNKRAS